MASSEGRPGSSIFEGWENWQIGLAVGAPICLGLAGLWYYKRSQNQTSQAQGSPKKKRASAEKSRTPEKQSGRAGGDASESSLPKEETPLGKAQAAKTKGNTYFKAGKYDEAIKCYTEALELCPPESKLEISTFYANRAAAYEKLKNPKLVIENCSEAIKLNGKYTKALWRRAVAAEQLSDFVLSLEDATAVCILEGFQNQVTLQMADRVLQSLGKQKAKDAMQNKKIGLPSKHFMKSYFASFSHDPVQKSFLPENDEQAAEKPAVNTEVNNVDTHTKPVEPTDGETPETQEQSSQPDHLEQSSQPDNHLEQSEAAGDSQKPEKEQVPQMNGEARDYIPKHCPLKTAVERLRCAKFEEVLPLCEEEVGREPASPHRQLALLLRGTMYTLSAQPQKAEEDYNELLAAENLDKKIKVNALIKRGSLFISQEKQTEGLADFAQAVRIDQSNSDIYHHRGHQNIQLDRLEDAIRDFENSILRNPDFPISHVQKSYAEHRLAAQEQSTMKLEKAIQSYEETLQKFPKCADGHALYAQALCDLGRFDDADNEFEMAIKLEPENANTLVHKAVLRLQWKQNIVEPVELIKRAMTLDDKCEYAYEILGTIEVQRGDMGKAVALFERAIELCRTESEMSHLFSLLHAAKAQLRAAQTLGIALPSHFSPM